MLEIRACADAADEAASLAIYNRVWPWDAIAMEDVESFKQQTLEYADHLALLDGEVAGSAVAALTAHRPGIAIALVTVPREHRRRGAGTALYRAISEWLRERGVATMDARVPEDDEEGYAFAARRGFVEVERNGRMVLELAGREPDAAPPPAGIEIVTWAERPELARGMYEVVCEAWPDIPGAEDEVLDSFEDWLAHDMGGAGDRPEATFVAVADGGEVVGYAKFSLTSAQPTVAHHDITGVKRSWRGRGIAGALKRAQIRWATEQGYERLVTQNEMRNEPIRRLNERLGYRPAPGRVLMRGPLAKL
jgi:GNAT superfamily N-acetyltransferase